MNLYGAIIHLFPEAIVDVDFKLQDNGAGPYIKFWASGKLGLQPSQAMLAQASIDWEAIQASIAYKELRRVEYPTVGDQLDAIWKDLSPTPGSDAETMKVAIEAVKTKYPKP
jgi:hypothetical protein